MGRSKAARENWRLQIGNPSEDQARLIHRKLRIEPVVRAIARTAITMANKVQKWGNCAGSQSSKISDRIVTLDTIEPKQT